jgi:hypothetical protein
MLANPEFVRNVRSQLRPAKIVTAIIIAAALSLVVGFALTHITAPAAGRFGWGVGLLHMLFWVQALILAAGGGIACVNAIYKEKEQNTFDYQRLTRLSPLELTLGKLFGAPIFMYFLCACMLPLVVFAAIRGRQSIAFVLAGYVALLVGSLAFHALALLISLLIVRGAHTSAIVFVLVILALFSSIPAGISYFFQLGSLSPFYASHVVTQSSWSVAEPAADVELQMPPDLDIDVFFGRTVRHFPVMVVVDALLLAWLLLALCRNIKRDPHQYELYSPWQSLGLVLFVNLILLAFVRWGSASLLDVQAALLTVNAVVVGAIGLGQLRSRDRTRRILRVRKETGTSWIDLAWPAPFLFIAATGAGLLVAAAAMRARNPLIAWSPAFAVFRSLFFAAWLMRDLQFLQWMALRRGKRPMVMGTLYLAVSYACVGILLSSTGIFADADRVPFTAFFLPTPIYDLDHAAWMLRPAIWGAAFLAQWLMVALFIYAQRKTVLELAHPAVPGSVSPIAT